MQAKMSARRELGPQQSIYWTMFSRIIWWNVGCWIPKCSQGTQSDEANSSLLGRYSRAMTWPSQLSNKNHAKNCLRQREKVGSVSHARHSQLRKFCAGQSAGDVHWSSLIIIDPLIHWFIDYDAILSLQTVTSYKPPTWIGWSEHIRLVATCCGNPASSTSSLAMWSWPPWQALCSAVQPSTEKCAKTSALYMTSRRVIFTFALQTSIDYVTQNRNSIGAEGLSFSPFSSGHHPQYVKIHSARIAMKQRHGASHMKPKSWIPNVFLLHRIITQLQQASNWFELITWGRTCTSTTLS